MCIEFRHLSCQVVVIKGLVYLLTYFIAVVIAAAAWNQLSHSRPWHWVSLALALTPLALLTSLSGIDVTS